MLEKTVIIDEGAIEQLINHLHINKLYAHYDNIIQDSLRTWEHIASEDASFTLSYSSQQEALEAMHDLKSRYKITCDNTDNNILHLNKQNVDDLQKRFSA